MRGSYTFDFMAVLRYWPELLQGAWLAALLSILTFLLGTVFGIFGAIGRISRRRAVSAASSLYVELFRNTPLLVQMYIFYYGLDALSINLSAFTAALLAMSLNSGAYETEIIRGGILAVGKGQLEAAFSIGMTYTQTLRKVVIPYALQVIFPPLGNQFIGIILGSSVASIITVPEITYVALNIGSRSYRDFETFLVIWVIYLALNLALSALFKLTGRIAFRPIL
ncbi:MAG TPA: amino acid ABC transporter permease [Candidatus Methylomirabilis sp.]|nr:amino acid ABC transporter permease [Candidatus Methylomirabilis sp.]HSC71187.1 amino acid ABC transporter permease [Candidatus Methylomirabilis sp.]